MYPFLNEFFAAYFQRVCLFAFSGLAVMVLPTHTHPIKEGFENIPASKKELNSLVQMGFFKPYFFEMESLYFYENPDLRKSILELSPCDSVVFTLTENGAFGISTAPAYLSPIHLKPDYELFLFQVISVGADLYGVVVNESDGTIRYVDKKAGEFIDWPEFLLGVASIAPLDTSQNPLRIKPLDHASKVETPYDFLKPLEIRDNWILCTLFMEDFSENGTAWIRWRQGAEIQIEYSLFF